MRTHGIPAGIGAPLFVDRDDARLKSHPAYRAAKSGDPAAAAGLLADLARPLAAQAARRFAAGSLYVAPHAREAAGDNAIPQVLAGTLALAASGILDNDIVQANQVFHTGANRMERLNAKPGFDGAVRRGGRYVLVDDVTTLGGTLAELADHIQAGGGAVEGVAVLVNASRSATLDAERGVLADLEKRYGDAIRETFGIEPSALTGPEARYLIGFRSADEIRNRSLKARQETDRRLRAKGLGRLGGGA